MGKDDLGESGYEVGVRKCCFGEGGVGGLENGGWGSDESVTHMEIKFDPMEKKLKVLEMNGANDRRNDLGEETERVNKLRELEVEFSDSKMKKGRMIS